jgi:hypothetical protein
MPDNYIITPELQAELEADYPDLDFKLEMRGLQANKFDKLQTDWDRTVRVWFYRSESWRKKSPTVIPGKDSGGDWRRDTTTTNKHSREIDRGYQQAMEDFYATQKQQQAITIPYEDITDADERLPHVCGVVERLGGVLQPRARSGQSLSAVLSPPRTL